MNSSQGISKIIQALDYVEISLLSYSITEQFSHAYSWASYKSGPRVCLKLNLILEYKLCQVFYHYVLGSSFTLFRTLGLRGNIGFLYLVTYLLLGP